MNNLWLIILAVVLPLVCIAAVLIIFLAREYKNESDKEFDPEKRKNFFSKVADMFGFKRSTKYVDKYLHKANIRSAIFMGAIIVILELWLVIRQHTEYIFELTKENGNYFKNVFDYTSLFWLNMSMGASLVAYSLYYQKAKKNKGLMMTIITFSAIGVILCCLLPMEGRIKNYNPKKVVDTVLLIVFYVSILAFHIATIIATIYQYKGGKNEWIRSVLIITLFALACLVFGVRVSYGDFFSTKDAKQIICFLTMAIYVACLLIWKPYISIGILGAVFLGFYFLLKSNASQRVLPDGDEVNYITFFISLTMVSVSIYNQRLHEARKDEELELLATVDKLTGLMTYTHFLNECNKKVITDNLKAGEYAYLFMNVNSFKVYNDQKGYVAGDAFLKNVGNIISEAFPGSFISRQSDDHFVAFVPNEKLLENLGEIREKVRALDEDIKPNLSIGYYVIEDNEVDSHAGVEKARYANAELKRKGKFDYLQYDMKLHDHFNLVQYVVSNVDEAIKNGWIVAYYQPVVYSKDNTLCGVEALARWIDPKYGFLNPGVFIGTLEDAHLAHKVDLAMLDIVCKNMRRVLDEGGQIVPTSINFSRADFSVVDIPEEVRKITSKYRIPTEYLHIEITESALIDEQFDLKEAMARLRKYGFAIWLDDFGSGYSSFNTIKDYAFDVVKLDMAFLKGFDKNEKSKPVIDSVIKMADNIHMHTLCEGVETKEQASFLKKIGCEKLQGYLFSKPISYEELNGKIAKGELVISKELF